MDHNHGGVVQSNKSSWQSLLRSHRGILVLLMVMLGAYGTFYARVSGVYRDDPNVHGVDTRWTAVGEHLFLNGVYSRGDRDASGALLPTMDPPPVYPLMHWASYAVFGRNARGLEVIRVVQFGMAVGIVLIAYAIGLVFSRRIAYTAATIAALDSTMFYFAMNYRVPNIPTAFFMSLALLFLVRFLRVQQSWTNIVLSAWFLVLAFHTRIALYLLWVPILVLLAAFLMRDYAIDRRRAALLVVFFVITSGAFWGWKVRNALVAGSSMFSSQSGEVYLDYRAGFLLARKWGMSHPEAQIILRDAYYTKVTHLTEGPKNEYLAEQGKRIIREHPIDYLRVAFAGTPALLLGSAPPYLFFDRQYLAPTIADLSQATGTLPYVRTLWQNGYYSYLLIYAVQKVYLVLLYLACVIGCMVRYTRRNNPWVLTLLLLCIVYLLVSSATPDATARYRAPFMVAFYTLASFGVMGSVDWFARALRSRNAAHA